MIELGAYTATPLHKGSVWQMPVQVWNAVRARWNEKNAPEENEEGSQTMTFNNTD